MELPELAFPACNFKIQSVPAGGQSSQIFDIVRKKYVALTPEEWVRQHLLHFLFNYKQIPLSLMSVEKKLRINRLERRTDIVVYGARLKPLLLAECKSPGVPVTQAVFDQAARYNLVMGVKFLLLTNGRTTYCCRINHATASYEFLPEIPGYSELSNLSENMTGH